MLTTIVLAAGFSKRLGRPKQLLVHEGETLVHRAARLARELGPVVVVVSSPEVAAAVEDLDVVIAENPDAAEGIASSIRRGVAACTGDVLLMVCDQPKITAEHLRALADATAPIAATGYRGIAGVPAFFAATFRDELLALHGDAGAKRVIEAHRSEVVVVAFEDAAVDVDTVDDAASLR